MGVDMRWVRACTAVTAGVVGMLPLRGELIVDPHDSKVVFKYEQPTQTMKLLNAKVVPSNFIAYTPRSLEQLLPMQYELKTLYSRENVHITDFEVSRPPIILYVAQSKYLFCIFFRLHRMHQMQTIVTDDRGCGLSVCYAAQLVFTVWGSSGAAFAKSRHGHLFDSS